MESNRPVRTCPKCGVMDTAPSIADSAFRTKSEVRLTTRQLRYLRGFSISGRYLYGSGGAPQKYIKSFTAILKSVSFLQLTRNNTNLRTLNYAAKWSYLHDLMWNLHTAQQGRSQGEMGEIPTKPNKLCRKMVLFPEALFLVTNFPK